MLLRDHPLLMYDGVSSWPPIWTWTNGAENKHPHGEVGILREVFLSNISSADLCFLCMSYQGSEYVGCLPIEDHAFCCQIVELLQGCLNRPIAEIGNLDLSYTL